MHQAVFRPPFTAEKLLPFHIIPCEICGEQSDTGISCRRPRMTKVCSKVQWYPSFRHQNVGELVCSLKDPSSTQTRVITFHHLYYHYYQPLQANTKI